MHSVAIVVFLSSIYTAFGQNTTEGGLQIPIINKCSCDALTVKTEKGCVSQNRSHFISLWDDVEEQDYPLDLALYNTSVVVQPVLDCPPGTTKEDSELDHAFIAIEDGRIIYHGFKTEHYCIETVLVAEGQIAQRLEACVENIKVRTCCKITETVDGNGTCSANKKILPELLPVQWLSGFDRYIRGVTCPDGELTIQHFPPIHVSADLRQLLSQHEVATDHRYCINLVDDGDEIQLGILSCNLISLLRIPLCCATMDTFNLNLPHEGCVPSSESYIFPENLVLPDQQLLWVPAPLTCTEFHILELPESDTHGILPNGSLVISSGTIINFDKYCLGAVRHNNETYHSGILCHHEDSPGICEWRFVIQSVCLAISSFFIILTIVVYLSIPDLRKKISSVCLISELFSLLVAQITLIVIYNKDTWGTKEGCICAGIIELVFVLASFFWLNVLCYNVWSTFRVLQPFSRKDLNFKIFIKYSLYAWGIPVVIGIIAVGLQEHQVQYSIHFTPEIGCFFTTFGEDYSIVHWIYLYGPILVLLLANLVFFIHLSMKLVPLQIERRRLRNNDHNQLTAPDISTNIEDVRLYARLFVIMGLPWLIELFTSFASVEIKCYIWFLDLFNTLRGILIFTIFVCNKETRGQVRKTWFSTSRSGLESLSQSPRTSTVSLGSVLANSRFRHSKTNNLKADTVDSRL